MKKIILLVVFFTTTASASNAQLASPGTIYASTSDGKIYELNEDFTQKGLVVQTDVEIVSMAINSKGEVYLASDSAIYLLNMDDATKAEIPLPPIFPAHSIGRIAFDANDQLYLLTYGSDPPGWYSLLYKYSFADASLENKGSYSTGSTKELSGEGLVSLAFEPYTNKLFSHVRYGVSGPVFELSLETYLQAVRIGSLLFFDNMFFDQKGGLYLFNESEVIAFNWVTGESSIVFSDEFPYNSLAGLIPPKDQQQPLAVFPSVLNFGDVLTNRTAFRELHLINRGGEAFDISFSNEPPAVEIIEGTEAISISPQAAVTLSVKLRTGDVGLVSDALHLNSNGEEHTVAIAGWAHTASVPVAGKTWFLTSDYTILDVSPNDWSMSTAGKAERALSKIAVNSAGEVYGVHGNSIFHLDPLTGKTSLIKRFSQGINAIVFDKDDQLLACVGRSSIVSGSRHASFLLYKYNTQSNETSEIPWQWLNGQFWGISSVVFSPLGQLYLLNADGEVVATDPGKWEPNWATFYKMGYGQEFTALIATGHNEMITITNNYELSGQNKLLRYNPKLKEFEVWKDMGDTEVISAAYFTKYTPLARTPANSIKSLLLYPNPFSEAATIKFSLLKPQPVRLEISDIGGRKVYSSQFNFSQAGPQQLQWDGTGSAGNRVPSGIYIIRLEAGDDPPVSRRIIYSR